MNRETDHLSALFESVEREGPVVRRPDGDVCIFDPVTAARVEAANTEALYVGDLPIDRLKRRGGRDRVPWTEIRAALTEQNRRLTEPRHVAALHERMRAFLRQRVDQELDLTFLVGRAVAFALIPQIIDGLSKAELKVLEDKQEAQVRKFMAPEENSFRLRLTHFMQLRQATRIFSREIRNRLVGKTPPRNDFLQSLLPFVERLGVGRVAYLVTTVLTAASVAPEFTACCLIYAMHLHPEWREKIEQEMAALDPKDLYALSIEKLPSTLRFIKETSRVWPFPFVVTRTAARDIKTDGVEVRKGTRYDLSAYIQHHLDDYWEDPERFDPDRWSSPRKKAAKGAYVPFGFASRTCVGGSIGNALLFLVCELFTREFRVEMAKGAMPRLTMHGIAVPVGMIGSISSRQPPTGRELAP